MALGFNPSIIGGLNTKPLDFGDPLKDATEAQNLRHLLLQGNAQQQAAADEEAVRNAYQQSGGDPAKLRQILYGAGQHKTIEALDKAALDNKVKSSTIDLNTSRASEQRALEQKHQDELAAAQRARAAQGVLSHDTYESAITPLDAALARTDLPEPAKQHLATIKTRLEATKGDPQAFIKERNMIALETLAPDKFATAIEPKPIMVDQKNQVQPALQARTGEVTPVGKPLAYGVSPNSAPGLALSPNGQKAYNDLATSGRLPAAYGKWGIDQRTQFLNQEGETRYGKNGTGVSIASDQAGDKSGAAALTAVQKDLAAIRPFKVMLDKNADIAIDLADKVTKVAPHLANKSINWISNNVSGNPDTAEYLAQIRIVQTEAARVLNNPRLVGQLTDSARHEMQDVVNGDMSFGQTKRVLRRIQADGNNRVNAMEQEFSNLQKGIGNKGSNAAPVNETMPNLAELARAELERRKGKK